MNDDKQKGPQNSERLKREARLNEALRANLKKRKSQGRKRTAPDADPAPDQAPDLAPNPSGDSHEG